MSASAEMACHTTENARMRSPGAHGSSSSQSALNCANPATLIGSEPTTRITGMYDSITARGISKPK